MNECAIHLPRLHTAIFQQENAVVRIQLPRRGESRLDQSQTAAKNFPFSHTLNHWLSVQVDLPRSCSAEKRSFQGGLVVASGHARARIESRRHHWAVEANPAE